MKLKKTLAILLAFTILFSSGLIPNVHAFSERNESNVLIKTPDNDEELQRNGEWREIYRINGSNSFTNAILGLGASKVASVLRTKLGISAPLYYLIEVAIVIVQENIETVYYTKIGEDMFDGVYLHRRITVYFYKDSGRFIQIGDPVVYEYTVGQGIYSH